MGELASLQITLLVFAVVGFQQAIVENIVYIEIVKLFKRVYRWPKK